MVFMSVLLKAILLFMLNLLDALLTLFWVRNDFAEEGNFLMAHLLSHGDMPFLLVKIGVGTIALLVFYRWAHLRISQLGLSLALGVYVLLMGIHLLTCFEAIKQIAL